MSFRPGGLESDDDDFIDFGECYPAGPGPGPPPLDRAISPSTRVDHEREGCCRVGCEDEDERQAGESGDVQHEVANGPR